MKSSIDEFVVVLDDPDCVYSPGQHVHGKVILKTKQPVKIHKLNLECSGEAYVSWPESSGTYVRYRYNKEEYYCLKCCIYETKGIVTEISDQSIYKCWMKYLHPNQPKCFDWRGRYYIINILVTYSIFNSFWTRRD